MSGSWMLLGGSRDSGNFETFLSPCSVQCCLRLIGWCASGGRLGWLSYEVSCLFSVLVEKTRFCVAEESTSGAWSTARSGQFLWLTNLHRSEISAELSQIQFWTWYFKLEVSVWDGIPAVCLAGAFYWASVNWRQSVKCLVEPATSCNVWGWFYVIVIISRECWSLSVSQLC